MMIINTLVDMFNSGEIWSILLKIVIGLILSGITTLIGTITVKVILKFKESMVYKYADTLVAAAEQKYPNEGTKMGPQKLDYVMSQLCIRFPKIRDSRYLYNVVEKSVFQFNEERQQQKLIKEFEHKHGEGSYLLKKKRVWNLNIFKKTSSQQEGEVIDNNSQVVNDDTNNTKRGKLKSY